MFSVTLSRGLMDIADWLYMIDRSPTNDRLNDIMYSNDGGLVMGPTTSKSETGLQYKTFGDNSRQVRIGKQK